jgi:hypothetical protein
MYGQRGVHQHDGVLSMQLHPEQDVLLTDGQGRALGRVTVVRLQGDLVIGKLNPGPDFPAVAGLFREFEEAANQQALSAADELGAAIDSLRLQLRPLDGSLGQEVHDVQVMNGHDFSCRLLPHAPAVGAVVRSEGTP